MSTVTTCPYCQPGRDPQEIEMQAKVYGWQIVPCGVDHGSPMVLSGNPPIALFAYLTLILLIALLFPEIGGNSAANSTKKNK